jgi:hypothetical protein
MANALKAYGDDGFNNNNNDNSQGSGGSPRANFLRWDNANHWRDRDGALKPELLLWLLSLSTCLRRWVEEGPPEEITAHPLPDVDELNSTIPEAEWLAGIDGRPRPPWEYTVKFNLVHPETGEFYVYAAATVGAQICFDAVKSSVIAMRAMKGLPVIPIVRLAEKPMKTKFGPKSRPHLEIAGWETPGGSASLPPTNDNPGPAPALEDAHSAPSGAEEKAAAEPPRGAKGRGSTTFTSGKQGKSEEWSQSTGPVSSEGKSKIRKATEKRRPDLAQTIDQSDPNEEIPF